MIRRLKKILLTILGASFSGTALFGVVSSQEPQASVMLSHPVTEDVVEFHSDSLEIDTIRIIKANLDTVIQPDTISLDSLNIASLRADSISADSIGGIRGVALPAIKVNPVDIDRQKPVQPGLHYYDKHGEPLKTPVRFLAELDTVAKVKSKPVYPAFNGVSIGVNFFDGVMMIAGQQRANFDIWADCSILNWFYPVVEAGVGIANATPDDGRFHFKVKPSPYFKVGLNYNFLYKSNPDYQAFIGLRACVSSFNYDITDIQAGSDYYSEDGPKNLYGLHSTAWYGQAVGGLKVKLWKFISLGWTIRFNFDFKQKDSEPDYPAWFTPGKGTSTPIAATFSLIFNFGQKKSYADVLSE